MSELKQELLITRTRRPRLLLDRVARPRLSSKLIEALQHKLVLLSAPAGYGKTTLIIEALRDYKNPIGWISLEASDNVPSNFWNYFILALQSVIPGACQPILNALQSPQPPPSEWLLTAIINSISGHDSDFALVLDDYHNIESPAIHEAVSFLIEHLPPQVHLIIASRIDPPLPLARWRVKGEFTEIRAADLRFAPAEAAEFLNQVMGLNLSAEDIAALENRTEGWIAGLQLAAIAMQGDKDTASFIKSFTGSHHFVLDYLVEEVLQKQSKSVQTFLLRTSILSRLCGSLCDAVVLDPSTSGQETLEYLEHANLFIVPLDNERRWYRYHHLFADLLRQRLEQTYLALAPKLHHQASTWFENENLIEEAVTHAFASHDWEHAANLVQHFAHRVHKQTNLTTLGGWLAVLPESVIRARPWLCVYQALAWYWTGPRERIEEYLHLAEQALPDSDMPEMEATLLAGYIAAIRSHYALVSGNLPRVLVMALAAIRQLPEDDYMRGSAAVALGGAYWGQGNVNASLQAFQTAKTVALQHNNRFLAVSPSCYVGMQLVKQGKLDEALCVYREGVEYATLVGGQQLPIAGFPKIKLGDVLREKNDLLGADQWLRPGIEQCIKLGHPDALADAYVTLARLQFAQNDWPGACATLQKADEVANKSPVDPFVRCSLDDCRVRLWLAKDRLDDLNRWAEASGLTVDGELSYHYDLHHLNLARVLLARARHASTPTGKNACLRQVSGLLSRLVAAAEKAGWVYETIKIMVLQALVFAESSDPKALQTMEDALALAEPGGFIRLFVDEGPPMARLLSEAAAQGIMPDYTRKLLAVFEDEEQKRPDKQSLQPAQSLIEPLSQRELKILQLIAQGLSNREISERLFLALDTVKGHNRKIFDKLQVQSRTEASARARELGLL